MNKSPSTALTVIEKPEFEPDATDSGLLLVFMKIWLTSAGPFICYFNWKCLSEHGFWGWFGDGAALAWFQGLLWPVFIFLS